jgi:hypothetical protein
MSVRRLLIRLSLFAAVALMSQGAWAADDVGSVVAVRGKAVIERDRKTLDAKVKERIFLGDTVSTREASRAKMLFADDSVLTLGERSTVVVREFLYGKDKGNKSLFNLIDGKMRSVVGGAGFEVRTPTASAAARGTIILFETGIRDGKKFTIVLCLEGLVYASKADSPESGHVTLKAGQMITVVEGEALPVPVEFSKEEKERLLKDTDVTDSEISIPGPMSIDLSWGLLSFRGWHERGELPPLLNQPPVQRTTTPVTIDVIFPGR